MALSLLVYSEEIDTVIFLIFGHICMAFSGAVAGFGSGRQLAANSSAAVPLTIFGFNTDIRNGETVYHVQTEAHESELKLQSAVFVRGRCIGKYSVSYAGEEQKALSEVHVHDLLTQQHKYVLGKVREGTIEDLLHGSSQNAAARVISAHEEIHVAPEQKINSSIASSVAAGAKPRPDSSEVLDLESLLKPDSHAESDGSKPDTKLSLEWIADESVCDANRVQMKFRLLAGCTAVAGARVIARLEIQGTGARYSQSVSDAAGEVNVQFPLTNPSAIGRSMTMLVQAGLDGNHVTRKFRLRRP